MICGASGSSFQRVTYGDIFGAIFCVCTMSCTIIHDPYIPYYV